MFCIRLSLLGVLSFFTLNVYAGTVFPEQLKTRIVAKSVLQILKEQPDSIESWRNDRLYLVAERLSVSNKGVFINSWNSSIQIPSFAIDQSGVFILCGREEATREAQEHYDRAGQALIEAIGHSAAAAATLEIPPVAIFEGYQAVESWKEAAREYNAGVECERKGG